MKSLEKKSEPSMNMPMSSNFPIFYVCDEQMPEIADWEVDKEYTIRVKVKMTNQTKRINMDSEDIDATMQMLSYEVEK